MKAITIVAIILVVAVAGAAYYFWGTMRQNGLKRGTVTVGEHAFAVDIAETMITRAQGLSGREGLGEDEGMLFLFSAPARHGFWMKDMLFPIDIIWIRDGAVIGFAENAKPEPEKSIVSLTVYYSPREADTVLEVNAGSVDAYGIEIGDAVTITR